MPLDGIEMEHAGLGVHLSDKYQDLPFISGIDYTVEWLRTTLVKKDGIWVMVEYCERVSEMVEPNRFIEETPGKTTVVTFLTDGFEDVEAMGFGVEGGEERAILEALERNPANARHPRECAVGTTGAGATS